MILTRKAHHLEVITASLDFLEARLRRTVISSHNRESLEPTEPALPRASLLSPADATVDVILLGA